ncbi:3-dehydroquinate synthase [Halolactibacillus alkaliphilus]|uniref:3-dehydroquinate synthase n=1 Tax=Halolactibacillus alkaliphilus TaxID=442899 RepID=A0A511X164_9BACI|nr:3-dehydroquinate synthase [Halolactibacillus alkaliphilus]GEN56688.1 3-dehydroquinate synthase [Halolactibacillus alkaliphilus]GGN70123.1 3-dehydroquinate synthase [Halolactibacillus alkaliphilus]SFO77723.1 3-dehydroquinate synthase [Halolactibacillus alkaliphilus]
MEKLTIKTSTHDYQVVIDKGLRFKLKSFINPRYQSVYIITDSNVATLYLDEVYNTLKDDFKVYYSIVPAGEESKSSHVYFDLMTQLIEAGLDRNGLIIALGGGMIGDLAGFVASTYLRGVDFIQMPTTILAHDSSVGGKVAINHPLGKNLIGAFYPPVAVIYDVDTLQTIPFREIRSGYAEIAKHSMIHQPPFWDQIIPVTLNESLDQKTLIRDLINGINVKAKIVEEDEREADIRQFLNFGHTLGHAIEAELGYGKMTHGEAVAIGMLFAMAVSEKHFKVDLPIQAFLEWLKHNNYPLTLPNLNVNKLMDRMKRDKKTKNQQIKMVLLESLGSPKMVDMDDVILRQQLETFLESMVIR